MQRHDLRQFAVARHAQFICGCREKAKGATFFEATEGETVRPMLDVSWAPMLGAFSVLFEEFSEGTPAVIPSLKGWRLRQ